jgi:hypothetical protein
LENLVEELQERVSAAKTPRTRTRLLKQLAAAGDEEAQRVVDEELPARRRAAEARYIERLLQRQSTEGTMDKEQRRKLKKAASTAKYRHRQKAKIAEGNEDAVARRDRHRVISREWKAKNQAASRPRKREMALAAREIDSRPTSGGEAVQQGLTPGRSDTPNSATRAQTPGTQTPPAADVVETSPAMTLPDPSATPGKRRSARLSTIAQQRQVVQDTQKTPDLSTSKHPSGSALSLEHTAEQDFEVAISTKRLRSSSLEDSDDEYHGSAVSDDDDTDASQGYGAGRPSAKRPRGSRATNADRGGRQNRFKALKERAEAGDEEAIPTLEEM